MNKTILGIILAIIGVLIFLFNFEILPREARYLVFSWETLMISIGLTLFFTPRNKVIGLILLIIGCLSWISTVLDIEIPTEKLIWPAIFVIIGCCFIFKKKTAMKQNEETIEQDSSFVESNFMGGIKKKILIQGLAGGSINNHFGGTEINLKDCSLALNNNTPTIEIKNVFGSVTLIVPADWNVINETSCTLGSFTDKRHSNSVITPNAIKITGNTTFGSIEVI